jgi:AcrR family transcriptional regulator
MSEPRAKIIEAGIAILREEGLAGFTQPRVARRAAMRQSHLTYYFPTRDDLLVAVVDAAVEERLARVRALPDAAPGEPAAVVAALVRASMSRKANRVLMAVAQAADSSPRVREVFERLSTGIREHASGVLSAVGVEPTPAAVTLFHSIVVGAAVLDLALGKLSVPPDEMLALALSALALKQPAKSNEPKTPRKRRTAR